MAKRILRRPKAAADVEEIADYIAKDSLESALRFLDCVEWTLLQLAKLPGCGSSFLSAHPELRNLRVFRVGDFRNHVIFYIEHVDAIEVIRVLHGARDLDSELRDS
jgi:toxin ParE1/3/4